MSLEWTEPQRNRLLELDADPGDLSRKFAADTDRDAAFHDISSRLVSARKKLLAALMGSRRRPAQRILESKLIEALTAAGFTEASTPLIMPKGLLEKMSIDRDHRLYRQIYWIDEGHCLRPMLAPHLYYVMKDLLRLSPKPVRIFEVGPCFRKESDGARHSPEFTMLNLCEFGLPADDREKRLQELAGLVMAAAGLTEYRMEQADSKVYGATLDVIDSRNGLELASGAMGPHELDRAWGIADAWVGIGFGVERMAMSAAGGRNISRFGRSISYLDGIRLNL